MTRRGRADSLRRSAWVMPLLVVTEVLLLSWYDDRGERSHWVTHVLVGAVVGLLGITFWVRARGRPPGSWEGVPVPVLVVVGAQLLGTAPDLLEGAGARQGRWMDVFLGSVSAHYAPMGNLTWAVLAAASVVTYVSAVRAVGPPRGRRGRRARPRC